jgi:hypothetical protein
LLSVQVFRTKRYQRDIRRLRLTADEALAIDQTLRERPDAGDVIPGLRGIRKVRFAFGSSGKRGGGRAIYFLILEDEAIVMLFAYGKAAKSDMSEAERKVALHVMESWKDEGQG